MITVKENTTLVGVSELRTHLDEILEAVKKNKVLLEKRNKPVAVLMDVKRYRYLEETLELLEDVALGALAQERDSKSKVSDFVDMDEAQKTVKSNTKKTKKK